MANHSNNFIRVRLHFEYPPPAVVDCRMCWLLVDLNRCRVVADLESVIREKFEFGRRSILSLFIEDCYLPHTESVYVVRDNDSVRVKVDHLAQVNGHSTSPLKEGSKKRQRPAEEDELEDKQKKKWKKRREESQEKQADGNKKSQDKHKKKKKRKEAVTVTPTKKTQASVAPPVKSPKKLPPAAKTQKVSSSDSSSSEEEDKAQRKPAPQKHAAANLPVKSTKNVPPGAKTQKASSSDSSSSSEEEDEAPKKAAPQKPAPKTLSAASKVPPITKPPLKKVNPPSSTSSDSSSDDEEESAKNLPKKKLFASDIPSKSENDKPQQAPSSLLSTNCAQKRSVSALPPGGKAVQDTSSDSEEEIKLVIRRPQLGLGSGGQAPWRGRGRGRGSPAERERGRGRGRRGHSNSFEYNYNGYKEPTTETDTLTNISVVLQNGAESVPKPDYGSMPLLAAPPLVGQKIAFKLLELTENYTPEVSEYKEGKIVNFDPTSKQVELELLHISQAAVEPGKFDLVYQNEDGSERVEYAVSRGSKVTERWDSLLEPRLII